jgi:hypothetical protein
LQHRFQSELYTSASKAPSCTQYELHRTCYGTVGIALNQRW